MNLPIETMDLGKRYGKVTAVKHLSLRVAEGEIYAFLGLNGAGKTTTIRMLLGMIKPTWGTAQVLQTRAVGIGQSAAACSQAPVFRRTGQWPGPGRDRRDS